MRLLEKIGKFSIFEVNGEFIRKNLDREFTNFGQHYRFPIIPKNEFWLDKEYTPGEADFFVDHLLLENKLMSKGVSYEKALFAADALEQKERKKTALAKRLRASSATVGELRIIHKKKLSVYGDKIIVWLVRGEAVRDRFYIDFTEGGHDLVYDFVPDGEVWIDDDLSIKERKFVILHELKERRLMGEGLPYPKAHREASAIEYHCRHFPLKVAKKIKEEVFLNMRKETLNKFQR